jgi:hypothetical protein
MSPRLLSANSVMQVYDSAGALLQTGVSGSGSDGHISQFVADQTDAYFARLVGSVTSYGLVVTRGADFDADSLSSLVGTEGLINGMESGFTGSDLTFTADSWRGSANDGEFEVSGTFFEV